MDKDRGASFRQPPDQFTPKGRELRETQSARKTVTQRARTPTGTRGLLRPAAMPPKRRSSRKDLREHNAKRIRTHDKPRENMTIVEKSPVAVGRTRPATNALKHISKKREPLESSSDMLYSVASDSSQCTVTFKDAEGTPSNEDTCGNNAKAGGMGLIDKLRGLYNCAFRGSMADINISQSHSGIPDMSQLSASQVQSPLVEGSFRTKHRTADVSYRDMQREKLVLCIRSTKSCASQIGLEVIEISSDSSLEMERKSRRRKRKLNVCVSPTVDFCPSRVYDIINDNLERLTARNRSKMSTHDGSFLSDHFYFVLDTNVLLQNLFFIEDLRKLKFCRTEGTIIFVPYCVIQRLDKLKNFANCDSISAPTLRAIRYINDKVENHGYGLQAQRAKDDANHLLEVHTYEDRIINCCLQLQKYVPHVMLLTDDTNLRNMGICNDVWVSSITDLATKHILN